MHSEETPKTEQKVLQTSLLNNTFFTLKTIDNRKCKKSNNNVTTTKKKQKNV